MLPAQEFVNSRREIPWGWSQGCLLPVTIQPLCTFPPLGTCPPRLVFSPLALLHKCECNPPACYNERKRRWGIHMKSSQRSLMQSYFGCRWGMSRDVLVNGCVCFSKVCAYMQKLVERLQYSVYMPCKRDTLNSWMLKQLAVKQGMCSCLDVMLSRNLTGMECMVLMLDLFILVLVTDRWYYFVVNNYWQVKASRHTV